MFVDMDFIYKVEIVYKYLMFKMQHITIQIMMEVYVTNVLMQQQVLITILHVYVQMDNFGMKQFVMSVQSIKQYKYHRQIKQVHVLVEVTN